VPLCHDCHHQQHQIGERAFWYDIDKVKQLANNLHTVSGIYKIATLAVLNYRMRHMEEKAYG
jgi:hypothetical protein